MPARAIWKGVLKIGSEEVPVKLYPAVQDRSIHFHILDTEHLERVKQRMVEPDTGKEVPPEEIHKGLEIEPDTFVAFNDEELAGLEPESSRDIEVVAFVTPEYIDPQRYERPYYLSPDGDESAYFALAKALESSCREGIARWVMRKKPYIGALRARDGYLYLITLRPADEVVKAKDLPVPTGRPLSDKEIQLAEQLVAALEDEFRPEDFRDEYRDRVMKFIEQKAKGHAPKLTGIAEKQASTSLLKALSASLKDTKRRGGKKVA